VIGAGVIGLMTVMCLRLIEPRCHITVMARYPHQVEAARRLGADEVIDHGDLYEQVARQTGARLYRAPLNRGMLLGGYDVTYDCVGHAGTILDSLRWTRARGTVVLIGIDFSLLRVDLNPVWYQEVDFIGSHTFGVERLNGRQPHTFELVIEHLLAGRLSESGLITHRFPLTEYRKAIDAARNKRSGAIKVTLTI
jgi:threonine dehydrogenase-like Zn-dependent dehydrogenase